MHFFFYWGSNKFYPPPSRSYLKHSRCSIPFYSIKGKVFKSWFMVTSQDFPVELMRFQRVALGNEELGGWTVLWLRVSYKIQIPGSTEDFWLDGCVLTALKAFSPVSRRPRPRTPLSCEGAYLLISEIIPQTIITTITRKNVCLWNVFPLKLIQ